MSARQIVHSIVWVAADLNFNKSIILLPSPFAFLFPFLFLFQRSHSHSHSQPERERERLLQTTTRNHRERERDEDHGAIGIEVQPRGHRSGDISKRLRRQPLRLFPEVQRQRIHPLCRSHRRQPYPSLPTPIRPARRSPISSFPLILGFFLRIGIPLWFRIYWHAVKLDSNNTFRFPISMLQFYYTKHTHTHTPETWFFWNWIM